MFLIPLDQILTLLKQRDITFRGTLHLGAHECEELETYKTYFGVCVENMIWIDALKDKVRLNKARGIPNVYYAVITDKDNETVEFKRTNNNESSSVLELGTHAINHPTIVVTERTMHTTTTIDTFMKQFADPSIYEFWNFDIQGAELLALKGAENNLKYAKALYLEINTEEVYKGCVIMKDLDTYLAERGFERVLTYFHPANWGDALYVRK